MGDKSAVSGVLEQLTVLPPLVFSEEICSLKKQLAEAVDGRAFLLQGEDCSENCCNVKSPDICEKFKILFQMALILSYVGGLPVIKTGCIAKEFNRLLSGKNATKKRNSLPSNQEDMVCSVDSLSKDCELNPCSLLNVYHLSASEMNLLRAFTDGGLSSLERVQGWNHELVSNSLMDQRYACLIREIDEVLCFIKNLGFSGEIPQIKQTQLYIYHKEILPCYEEALTCFDHFTEKWYDCSAHILWIEDSVYQVNKDYIEFLRKVHNPIGIKIRSKNKIDDIKRLITLLNPTNEKGRLVLITQLEKNGFKKSLSKLLREIKREDFHVVWCCDIMDTDKHKNDSKNIKDISDIISKIISFFNIHSAEGTIPGGIHLKMTSDDAKMKYKNKKSVIEKKSFLSSDDNFCYPYLNAKQSLEVALKIAETLRQHTMESYLKK